MQCRRYVDVAKARQDGTNNFFIGTKGGDYGCESALIKEESSNHRPWLWNPRIVKVLKGLISNSQNVL